MLVLSRKTGERIWIGEDISITVVRITGGGVRIGIDAPADLAVVREELKLKLQQADAEAPPSQPQLANGSHPETIKFPTR